MARRFSQAAIPQHVRVDPTSQANAGTVFHASALYSRWLRSKLRAFARGMSCLGVHFALTDAEVAHLRSLVDEAARLNHLQEVIEESYFEKHPALTAESDKAWDAMHRTLADGKLTWNGGKYPLNHVVLAGEFLYTDSDYIMSLKTPQQVRDIADALPAITEAEFRRRYFSINPRNYSIPLSEEDFEYTWHWFQRVRKFYARAAKKGRFVLFTADQ